MFLTQDHREAHQRPQGGGRLWRRCLLPDVPQGVGRDFACGLAIRHVGPRARKQAGERGRAFFRCYRAELNTFNADAGGSFLHNAPHAGARLRFEGVGTRAGPRSSGGYGEADQTIPRNCDVEWSAFCRTDLRPTLLHPSVGVERAGPLASPYGAGAPPSRHAHCMDMCARARSPVASRHGGWPSSCS